MAYFTISKVPKMGVLKEVYQKFMRLFIEFKTVILEKPVEQ